MVPEYSLKVSAILLFVKTNSRFSVNLIQVINLDVLIRKIRLTAYPERFTILRVVSAEVFKLSIFIQDSMIF